MLAGGTRRLQLARAGPPGVAAEGLRPSGRAWLGPRAAARSRACRGGESVIESAARDDTVDIRGVWGASQGRGRARGGRLGAYPARFQSGTLVRAPVRRLVL